MAKKNKAKAAKLAVHSRPELVILVAIIAVLALLIMFLKYPGA
jgi:hypothetical protein